jgi:dTMP kinase
MIIAIEGIDASGKATQSKLLAQRLGAAKFSFPNYDTPSGIIIKKMLTERAWMVPKIHHAETFQAMQTINRLEQYGLITSLQAMGKPIVFDRFYVSALIYGSCDGVSEDWLRFIQAPLPEPTHQIFLDIPVEESFRRRSMRRDVNERNKAYLENIRTAYLALFNRMRKLQYHGDNAKRLSWHIVDGLGTIEEVHTLICDAIGI